MIPKRIRDLLEAQPFIPFKVHLTDGHSVHIGDPAHARLEDDGRSLLVESLGRSEIYFETMDTSAITRLIGRLPLPPDPIHSVPEKSVAPRKVRVLFICTHNGARSQMAEAWMNHLGGNWIEAESAGYEPGELQPLAVEAMREVGIDISKQKPKSIFDRYRSGAAFAATICVCDQSAEKAPVFPGQTKRLLWSVPDPLVGDDGSEAGTLGRMRMVRDALRQQVETWLREMNVS
jgi:arsenate reductase